MGSFKKDGKRVKKKIPSEKSPEWHLFQSKFIETLTRFIKHSYAKKIEFYSRRYIFGHLRRWQMALSVDFIGNSRGHKEIQLYVNVIYEVI
eukprot:721234_1